jgi:type VI secretion system protein ImpL
VTIKSLLFCLFLYVCLVWVGAAYLYPAEILHYGLLWTAIGLIAVLAFLIVSRLFGWWRLWRAKAAARPANPTKPVPTTHPDDEALRLLIAEANAVLARAPSFAGKGRTPLSAMPLYLLIGPDGSGKTSTFLNSGLEPQFLAGQVAGSVPVAPTRLFNFWLAKNAIFVEMGGRTFGGEISRLSELLRMLRGRSDIPFWRRLWSEPDQPMDLRGVIAFCDSKELTGASSDPQRLERLSRDWQERLRAIAGVFGIPFPVYQVITKCDKIPFFSEFFRRLPETEAGQVLGCTVAPRTVGTSSSDTSTMTEVFAEAEAKRLTSSFRPLYHALCERRLTQLAHEPDPAQRPAIYEFPRELKRIRSPLVQFLTDVFRPDAFGPNPVLRGYYLTGVRESAAMDPGLTQTGISARNPSIETVRPFDGDATRIFQTDDAGRAPGPGIRRNLGERWVFVADLFHKIILADYTPSAIRPIDERLRRYRKLAFGAVCGVCILLCIAFIASWTLNRRLLGDIARAGSNRTDPRGQLPTLNDLKSLDDLRNQVAGLQGHWPIRYHWGLYSGDRVLKATREAYFRRFRELLLNDLNGVMVADLGSLPVSPPAYAPYEPIYRTLKTHLIISSGSCPVDTSLVSSVLKEYRSRIVPGAASEWQMLADRQIDFYASELKNGNPVPLREDAEGRERARQYLRQIKGVERFYVGILANAEKAGLKTTRLGDLASNYTQVLSGPAEVSSVFSHDGWKYVEEQSKKADAGAPGDACVVGSRVAGQSKQDAETTQAIQRMFLRDYADHWRKFVEGFSVTKYASAQDAARKLEILSDHKSPLLAVLVMTSNQTSFLLPGSQPDANLIQKGIGKVDKLMGSFKKAASEANASASPPDDPPDILNSPEDIARSFQPVDAVVPPGSDPWVSDKNKTYIDALAQLANAMKDIAHASESPDAEAAHQAARDSYRKALDTVRQIAEGFKASGVSNLDVTVKSLLEAPIINADHLIIDKGKVAPGIAMAKVNGELRAFCNSETRTLHKYPFQQDSPDDVGPSEFTGVLDALSQFQKSSLADFTVKDGIWKAKDSATKLQVTAQMLAFLNRAEQVRQAFYATGVTQPQFTYTLRPNLDPRWNGYSLKLEINGQAHVWTTGLQHQFSWPNATDPRNSSAALGLHGPVDLPIDSRPGAWGIFRIFGDAEPRELNDKHVEWKHGGIGQPGKIDPPVQLDIAGFPGEQDIFNPKFWEGFKCPPSAVQ